MEVNQLERLEAFEARDARQLTLATASLLINSCPTLVSLLACPPGEESKKRSWLC